MYAPRHRHQAMGHNCYSTKEKICLHFGISMLPCKAKSKCFTRLNEDTEDVTVCYWDICKLITYQALSKLLKVPAGKSSKPTERWGNLKVLRPVRPNHATAWNTTAETPSHNIIGSIFSFFLNKIKTMLCLTTYSIWHLITHGNKDSLLCNLEVL